MKISHGRNRVVLIVGEIPAIYGFGKNVQKSKAYHRISLVKGAEALQSVVNKPTHGKLRRIISQGFAESFIRASSSEVLDVARILCRRLGEPRDDFAQVPLANPDDDDDGWTCPKNMAVWCESIHLLRQECPPEPRRVDARKQLTVNWYPSRPLHF